MSNQTKVPIGNPMGHLYRMFYYFAGSSVLVTLTLGTVTGSWLLAIGAMIVAGALALAGGIFVTMMARSVFKLMQTGRIVQYLGFWLSSYASVSLCSFFLAGTLTFASPLLASLVLFVAAFGPATLLGEVPIKGRTWLPVRRKGSM